MSKLVTNDNLKAYHAELAEHIKLLQRNTAYALNDIVNYDGITLKCTTAGTTDTTRPNISTLSVGSTYTDGTCVWTRIDLDKRGIDYYVASKDYVVDDQVIYDNKIYKCITAHTSTSTFDTTKWAEISAGGGGGISVWQANTEYAVNDVVIDSNLIWQCATSHTSTTTFDESKWICISGGEISNGMEIVPLWEGEFSFDNSTQGSWPTSSTTMMELSESIDNFEHIYVTTCADSRNNHVSTIVPVSSFNNDKSIRVSMYESTSQSYNIEIVKYDSLHLAIIKKSMAGWTSGYVKSVRGIRKAKPIVSSGMKYETLWEGEAGSLNTTSGTSQITLSKSYLMYNKLGFNFTVDDSGTPAYYYREIDVNMLLNLVSEHISFCWGYSNEDDYVELNAPSSNILLNIKYKSTILTKIIGISEGVQIPTGVQAVRVTLWEGFNNTLNSLQTLSDSIKNYDQFEVTYANNGNGEFQTRFFNVSDINNFSGTFHCDGFASWGNPPYYFVLTFDFASETTWKLDSVQGNGWNFGITKIVGIKYIQPDSYSTEEKLIGTWIDGKPLYRKVFTGTAPSSADVNTNIFTDPLFTNVDMCYVKDGYIKRDAGSGDIDFYKINESMDSDYRSSIFISGSESSIRGAVGRRLTSRPLVVIVEYTKN